MNCSASIVFSQAFHQDGISTGGGMSATDLYTPTATGLFRVSSYIAVTAPTPSESFSVTGSATLTWTDEVTTYSVTTALTGAGSTDQNPNSRFIQAVASEPIQIATLIDFGQPDVTATYDLFVVIEQLG
jgi:hypothetical protein